MAVREIKTKKILYKEVQIPGQKKTVQEMLSEVLNKNQKADLRKELVNPNEDNLFRLINKNELFQGVLFCQLVAFEPGHSQRYIQLESDAESYKIRSVTSTELAQLSEEKADEVKSEQAKVVREFIDSILYFGVFDNNIVVMQSRSLTTRELETHLRWLLGTLASAIPAECILKLTDKPKEEVIEEILRKPVKSVSIGAPVETTLSRGSSDQQASWVPSGTAAGLIKAMLAEKWDSFLKSTPLDSCLDDANLEVTLKISYKRNTSNGGEKMLRNLVDATRHYPDEDVTVEMVGGTKLTGKDIRLWNTVKLVTYNSLIDEHDLYGQMHEWLQSLLNAGEIDYEDEKK